MADIEVQDLGKTYVVPEREGGVKAALVSLARTARNLTPTPSLAWTLVAILIPVLGPLAWLFIGRRSADPRSAG